jgi:hypothetical protein
MFPPNAILFAGIVGFIAALVTGWIMYRRVYARRLQLEREVREREPELERELDPEAPRAAPRRREGRERPVGEDAIP